MIYLDCFNGISTHLLLSALIDAGASTRFIEEKLGAYDFRLKAEKQTESDFPSTKADIFVNDDKTLSLSEALELTKNIHDENIRCIIMSALGNLKHIKMSEYLRVCACIFAYSNLDTDYAMSSPIIEGVGYDDAEPVPTPDVLEIIKINNVAYKVSSRHKKMIYAGGVSVISALVKEYGVMPDMDILKIGYGNDGENYLRVVIGIQKQKNVSDFFEMSLDFDIKSSSSFVCGESK